MAKPRKCPSCTEGIIKNQKALNCWNCYNKFFRKVWNKGKKGIQSGDKHPRWKGGKWTYWRKQALIRDNYTCKICGLYDIEIMDVDHIEPIRCTLRERREIERETDIQLHGINNLQTLCPNCHKRKTIKQFKNPVHLKLR